MFQSCLATENRLRHELTKNRRLFSVGKLEWRTTIKVVFHLHMYYAHRGSAIKNGFLEKKTK